MGKNILWVLWFGSQKYGGSQWYLFFHCELVVRSSPKSEMEGGKFGDLGVTEAGISAVEKWKEVSGENWINNKH